jgi:polyketide synthase Type III
MVTTYSPARPRVTSIGTAVPPNSYTQQELLDIFAIEDDRVRGVFLNGGIERRHLTLPPEQPDGTRRIEEQGELLAKHTRSGVAIGAEAVEKCLKRAGAGISDLEYLCCVSSTGFITPGFSALLIK